MKISTYFSSLMRLNQVSMRETVGSTIYSNYKYADGNM